jgi:CHAD domain-containing protein
MPLSPPSPPEDLSEPLDSPVGAGAGSNGSAELHDGTARADDASSVAAAAVAAPAAAGPARGEPLGAEPSADEYLADVAAAEDDGAADALAVEPPQVAEDEALTQRTVSLTAPPQFRVLDLGAIADDVVLTAGAPRTLTTVYFDTPDLRLVRWSAELRYGASEGWTVRLPDHSSAGGRELHFKGRASTPPAEALDMLTAYIRSARVHPVARLRTVRRTVAVNTHDGQRLAEIDDDEVSVLDGRRVAGRFREVDVHVLDGAQRALVKRLVDGLHKTGCGIVDPVPRLVRALGARAMEPPDVVLPDVDKQSTAGDAVRRAIAASVLRALEHDAGLRLDLEPEDVHQARVATRRLRSDLRTFAPVLEPTFSEPIREELRWLGGELGAVRDAEVLAMRLHDRAAALPSQDVVVGMKVVSALDEQVQAARSELADIIRTPRYVNLLDSLVDAAREPVLTEVAQQPAAEVCPGLVATPWRRLRRAVSRLGDPPADDELHQIRIRAKRCRYAAEAVAPVLGKRATAFARAAASLQEVLGDFHDAVVAADWLRVHAGRGIRSAFVAGQLYAQELAAAQHGRDIWRDAYKPVRRTWPHWS